MRAEDYSGPFTNKVVNGRHGRLYAAVIGDVTVCGALGNIEINPNQNASAAYLNIPDCQFVHIFIERRLYP
jgi:hypothetical protein